MHLPSFFTDELYHRLLANGRIGQQAPFDAYPVVKLFTSDSSVTVLLTELDPDQPDLAYGLIDLGMGDPELGYVRLSELQTLRGSLGLPIERDRHFHADRPLSEYTRLARAEGRIVA